MAKPQKPAVQRAAPKQRSSKAVRGPGKTAAPKRSESRLVATRPIAAKKPAAAKAKVPPKAAAKKAAVKSSAGKRPAVKTAPGKNAAAAKPSVKAKAVARRPLARGPAVPVVKPPSVKPPSRPAVEAPPPAAPLPSFEAKKPLEAAKTPKPKKPLAAKKPLEAKTRAEATTPEGATAPLSGKTSAEGKKPGVAKAHAVAKVVAPVRPAAPRLPLGAAVEGYIGELGDWRGEAVDRICQLLAAHAPRATGVIKFGHPVYEQHGPLAYVVAHPHIVHFGFWRGARLEDPEKLLVGEGEVMRHAKLWSASEVREERFIAWIREAVRLNDELGDPTKPSA